MRQRWLMVAVLALAIIATGCGGGVSQTALERDLERELEIVLAPIEVKDTTCPDDLSMEVESVFVCVSEVADQEYEIQVTIIDAQGRFDHERRHAVIDVVGAEIQLADEASDDLGFRVVADCGDNEFLVVSVGNNFTCALTDDAGHDNNIEVTVRDEDGKVSWVLS
jgi:predicted nucleic acid-binding protein